MLLNYTTYILKYTAITKHYTIDTHFMAMGSVEYAIYIK